MFSTNTLSHQVSGTAIGQLPAGVCRENDSGGEHRWLSLDLFK